MKKIIPSFLLAAACSVALLATTARAADAKSYQVTGPVLEVTPTTFTVQKGEEKWEIARDKGTKMNGEVKVGSKVTIYYRMVATEVEIKDAKTAPKTDTKKKKTQ
jgi:hypothetical protein